MKTKIVPAFLLGSCLIGLGCSQEPPATKSPVGSIQSQGRVDKATGDISAIAQLIIDLDVLQQYYHVDEVKGRKPLLIVRNKYMKHEPRLTKFGESVRFVSQSEAGDRPYLVFTNIEIAGETASVNFQYPVEGVLGSVNLRKLNASWRVEDRELYER